MPRSHRLTIRVSDHSQSTESDQTPSDHTDDEEYSTGVPLDSVSTGSQVDYTDEEDIVEDDFVRLGYRHVRRPAHVEGDDIEPSDSASRPATSRQSSQHRGPGEAPGRGHSRRRNPAPEPPPHPRPARGGPRVPREPPLGRPPRPESIHGPESFHSDSLDHDDYPYGGPGGLPYRPGRAPGWGHVPTGYGFPEPSVLTTPDHFARQDMMQPYRDPFYDNPFAAQGGPPYDDMYEPMPPPQRRPRPPMRHSMGARDFALMPYGRDPYGYDPYGRDPYSYGRRPLPPEMRSLSPEKHSHAPEHHSKPPTPAAPPPPPMAIPPPMPIPSPGDERLAKLELLILEQTEDNRRRAHDKMALRAEDERKKKLAEEKTQSEKLIALEKLLMKQNEEAIAREMAMEKKREAAEASAAAKMAKEVAEKAATEKIAKELQEAADKAKKAAEAEAEKKAKEAKEAADKELAALKEKHDAAEEAKKKAEEEAEKLKPKGTPAPIRFKDAVGRKFQFPYDICKTWKGMEGLIKQAFLHVDLLGPHVLEGHYDLIGPDGEIILPQVWETMIKPDYAIEMQMWPIPELDKGKDKLPFPMPGGHGHGHGHGGPHGGPPGMMPAIDDLLKGIGGGGKRDKKGRKGAKVVIPPLPPLGSVIPPPPGGPMMGGPMMGGMPPMPGGIPPPPMGPIGGAGPGLAALSLGEDPMRRKKSGKSKSKNEVPAIMRWAAGSKRR